jgi:Second Messenger Oligonucleotide or Dinucleotide Synthetase domain
MNKLLNSPPLGSTAPVGEILLAETAIRIELPPSLHQLVVDRYEAVRKHIERAESPLRDRVTWFYPQGSMAIRATIKARRREDGFDIDIVAELVLPPKLPPAQVIDLLFQAIDGPPGSMYHGMVERQTRCVTVFYADGMHIDITPAELLDELDPRRSHICHANPKEPPATHLRPIMNSWAFCDWFNACTPADVIFEEAYAKRARTLDKRRIVADADVKPVPAHSTLERGKSSAVVALQLLKRNRNVRYLSRKGRMPPYSDLVASVQALCLSSHMSWRRGPTMNRNASGRMIMPRTIGTLRGASIRRSRARQTVRITPTLRNIAISAGGGCDAMRGDGMMIICAWSQA